MKALLLLEANPLGVASIAHRNLSHMSRENQ